MFGGLRERSRLSVPVVEGGPLMPPDELPSDPTRPLKPVFPLVALGLVFGGGRESCDVARCRKFAWLSYAEVVTIRGCGGRLLERPGGAA